MASTPAASKRRRREATQEVEKYPGKNTGKKEKVRLCKYEHRLQAGWTRKKRISVPVPVPVPVRDN